MPGFFKMIAGNFNDFPRRVAVEIVPVDGNTTCVKFPYGRQHGFPIITFSANRWDSRNFRNLKLLAFQSHQLQNQGIQIILLKYDNYLMQIF